MSEAPRTEGDASFGEALTRNVRTLRAGLVVVAVVSLGIVVALALLLVWRQYENAKSEAARELRTRAILASTVFDTYFAGQLAALSAIAVSPTVVQGDPDAMAEYFSRFRPGGTGTFSAGVGWIDLDGRQRATSDPNGPITANLADRSYFSTVVSTKKPFVSEVIVARRTERRIIVMSVPTRDTRGRVTGVLAGGIVLTQSTDGERAAALGYEGLEIIDREGQLLTRPDLARPRNADLVKKLKLAKEGLLVDTRGLDGSDGRVVAHASSAAPGWTTVLDEPVSTVFADARSALIREALLIGVAATILLALLAWVALLSRRQLRTGRAQVSRWAELTGSLNSAVDSGEIRELLATTLAAEFPAGSAIVALDVTEGETADPATVVHGDRSPFRGEDVAPAVAEVVAGAGLPATLESGSQVRAHAPLLGRLGEQARSLYAVPLLDEGQIPVGSAVLLFPAEHALAGYQVALARAHAEQAAQALVRVRRLEREHEVTVQLQQSLLPDELASAEGISIAAHYRAGVANTSVGGDWYDAVRRPDGIVHFTVGDVAGRGIEAAVAMGELRIAFRAYALEHVSPAAIVQRLGRHIAADGMATTVCATYDPYTQELTYASAGHPPPLLVDPVEGAVARLEPSGSGPLGWHTPSAREKQVTVSPGTMLVLYTDGLVERRDAGLDEGIDRLAAAVLEALKAGAPNPADAVVAGVVEPQAEDDLALLLVGFQGAPSVLRIDLPAEPALLRGLRGRVRAWLEARGLGESAYDVVLALSEACSNAIEHGYRNGGGTVRILLDHRGESLTIRVADDGSWREPEESSTRGRGLVIMRGLMSSADIVRRADGTEVVLEYRP